MTTDACHQKTHFIYCYSYVKVEHSVIPYYTTILRDILSQYYLDCYTILFWMILKQIMLCVSIKVHLSFV